MQEIMYIMNLLKERIFFLFFLSLAPQHWNAQFYLQKKLSLVQVLRESGGVDI